MNLKSIIKTPDDFKAAQAIANGIDSIKSEMMIKCFRYIEEYIVERSDGKLKPIHSNYVERAKSFYSQASTTWPTLCYLLDRHDPSPDKDLIMHIEIDYRLYYGVTN